MTPDGRDGGLRAAVSVVICAYTEDRWGDILAAVDSVRAQSLPPYETLLVVDHNPALLERLTARYAGSAGSGDGDGEGEGDGDGVRVLANAGPRGLSAGRNTGVEASTGEIIAFLDDDAVAERDWLRTFVAAYADPLVLAVGGRTEPVWESGRRPAWFPEEFDWTVGCMYLGHPRGRVPVRNVLGGNASFRRSAFEAVGGFATGIGRNGDRLPLGCEETELCIRLRRARPDATLLIDDGAVIHHRVPAARERLAYLRTRSFAEGVSKARVARLVGAQDGLATERSYTSRVLPAGVVRGLRDALLGRPGGAGRAGAIVLGTAAAAAGYAVGTVQARRGSPGEAGTASTAGTAVTAEAVGTAAVPSAGAAPRGVTLTGSAAGPGGVTAPGRARSRAASADGASGVRRRLPVLPVPVLMYHAVSDDPAPATRTLSVSPAAFAEQTALLADRGFTPITASELGDAWRSDGPLPPRPVLLTFDDGYEGVHTHALPALARHGFRASLFVSSGWLRGPCEAGGALDTMLDWEQVRELAGAGVEIGGHSHTHPQLDQLDDEALHHEITHCRDLVAAETGVKPVSFAYPYGYSSRRVRQAVLDGGFAQSLAVNNALASRRQSPYALTRLTVRRSTDLAEFERLVEGRAIGRNYALDRALGKGYAVVRRTRRTWGVLHAPDGGRTGRTGRAGRAGRTDGTARTAWADSADDTAGSTRTP